MEANQSLDGGRACFDQSVEVATQWVRTSWSKRSRGGAQAARRNAVPDGFVLPDVRLPLVHTVTMDERSEFQPRWELEHVEPDVEEVVLSEADGLLRVQLTVTAFGMPRRWRRPPAVRLARDEWLRWQINYRFVDSSSGEWRYRHETLNLAYGSVGPNTFVGTPSRRVDELAQLR